MTRVTLVMGAGGVGKTTVAAGLAALSARNGATTLAMTVDPARRLAATLGSHLGNDPVAVAGHPGLDAAMLDAGAAWRRIATEHATPATARRLVANPYFLAVADRFPSGQAYAAAEQLFAHVSGGRYEHIVVDTPPAAGGAAFLAAPARIRELVAGRALRLLTGPRLPGRRLVYSVTARPALKVADAVLGGRLLEDLAEFLIDLSDIYPGVARRSRQVEAMLASARLCAVTTPDPGPLAQARRLVSARTGTEADRNLIVFNRMLPGSWADAVPAPGPLGENLARWGAEAGRHRELLHSFAAHTGLDPAVIPWLPAAPVGPGPLADLVAGAGLRR